MRAIVYALKSLVFISDSVLTVFYVSKPYFPMYLCLLLAAGVRCEARTIGLCVSVLVHARPVPRLILRDGAEEPHDSLIALVRTFSGTC